MMSVRGPSVRRMVIDCETCLMRDHACADCVVTFLAPPRDLTVAESRAVAVLARSGLVPPLRMARRERGSEPTGSPVRPGGGRCA